MEKVEVTVAFEMLNGNSFTREVELNASNSRAVDPTLIRIADWLRNKTWISDRKDTVMHNTKHISRYWLL